MALNVEDLAASDELKVYHNEEEDEPDIERKKEDFLLTEYRNNLLRNVYLYQQNQNFLGSPFLFGNTPNNYHSSLFSNEFNRIRSAENGSFSNYMTSNTFNTFKSSIESTSNRFQVPTTTSQSINQSEIHSSNNFINKHQSSFSPPNLSNHNSLPSNGFTFNPLADQFRAAYAKFYSDAIKLHHQEREKAENKQQTIPNQFGSASTVNQMNISPYSMFNLLNSNLPMNHLSASNESKTSSFNNVYNGSDANNNNNSSTSNIKSNSNFNSSSFDRPHLANQQASRQREINRDLSKENHINYSNVNNLSNQPNHQKSLNSSSTINEVRTPVSQSRISLANSIIPYQYYNHASTILAFNQFDEASNKRDTSNESFVNSKLFPSSNTFSTSHPFSANSLSKINDTMTNGLNNNLQSSNLISNLNSSGNSAFSPSNGLLAQACSLQSSSSSVCSAASALSALSSFSLTESLNKKTSPFYSSTTVDHSNSINRLINDKTNHNSQTNGHSNGLTNDSTVSKRIKTPVTSASLKPQLTNFNNAMNIPFTQLNQHLNSHISQHLSQHFNPQLSQNYTGFDTEKNNLIDITSSCKNPLSQSSNNLNTSNSNSLGSMNDSTGELSDSMSKSMSKSLNNSVTANGPGIKKPLNAFMLFMQDYRVSVRNESPSKESAAINQKLGKMWRDLPTEKQEEYFERARRIREMHHRLYPNWTAKDNYAINIRKKKRKKEKTAQMRQFREYTNSGSLKKCRARYTTDQKDKWCKPCLRKKACIKFKDNPASN